MSATENVENFEKLKLDEADDSNYESFSKLTVVSMATTIEEVLESIKRVGYEGPLLDEAELRKALVDGPKNIEYSKLVCYIANEIRVLRDLDECVNPITAPEDSATFIMEISSFLKELGCPFPLTQGHVSDRFTTEEDKLLLLEYLAASTLMARIYRESNPGKKIELKLHESPQAADLRKMLQTFGISKPPSNITMKKLMEKLIPIIQTAVNKAGPDLLGHPILNATLTPKKWDMLNDIQESLHNDFRIRREMLLKRLDCTIQSFQWSNKTKGKEELFNKIFAERRKQLKVEPEVDISDLLAARNDLAIIEKTSSASVRKNTKSAINSVIIGQVPDRGGRTSEQAPPPPEMPPWQQQNSGPGWGGGFRGGRGGSSNFSRGGGSNFSRGGQQGAFGGGNSYSQTSNHFSSYGNSQSGNNYSRDNPYKSEDSYRGGASATARGSFDSAGSYGKNDNNSKGSGSYSSYDNRRSNDSYSQGNYTSKSMGFSSGSGGFSSERDTGYSAGSGGNYSQTTNKGGFDSAGGYGGYSQDAKRSKTLDQYQPNKTTYADQYVQESTRNQQHHARGDNKGSQSGRSNYYRGGGGGSGYR